MARGKATGKKMSMKERADSYAEQVAEEMIRRLKEGTAPWQKSWKPGAAPGMPFNAATGKPYRGINVFYLQILQPNEDPRWLTFNQAKKMGASVRKGEKSSVVEYWLWHDRKPKMDDEGNPVLDDEGNKQYITYLRETPKVMFYNVFHASQVDGLPEHDPEKNAEPEWAIHQRVEKLVENSGAIVRHDQGNRAFYAPDLDQIHLPQKGQFPEAKNYYATMLHELGHWTGHESRLNRNLDGGFGSKNYAMEELRSEMASVLCAMRYGVAHEVDSQHAAYVGSWIKRLRKDPRELMRAARDAEKIVDFMDQFDPGPLADAREDVAPEDEDPEDRALREAGLASGGSVPAPSPPSSPETPQGQERIFDPEDFKDARPPEPEEAKTESSDTDNLFDDFMDDLFSPNQTQSSGPSMGR